MSQKSYSKSAVAVVVALLLGCTQAARTGIEPNRLSFSTAGNTFARSTAMMVETQTVSLALDRIDQRDLPLDHTYRRRGTGRGVTVYVFDGGVLPTHPELLGRVRKGFDAFESDPPVCNAHGTAVAGAVAGKTLGVAPEARIVDVKMVECSKLRGTIRAIVEGAKWVIEDHKRIGGPAVANWSFIADTLSRIPALDSAVALLRAAGIPVIVSAGNAEINACRVSPGNADGAIVVGASTVGRASQSDARIIDRRADQTAYGPCVDVYAPGDSVLLPSFDNSKLPSVQLWNGTSMSTGYVSGAAALFLESNPHATPDQVLQHFRGTGTRNVVKDTGSPISWLLYVGPVKEELKSVEEIRAQLAKR